MKKEFVKAEVQVIKFECHDILTGPSTDENFYRNDKLGAYVRKGDNLMNQIYNTDYTLGIRENNVEGPGLGLFGAWGWMSIEKFKANSDLMSSISSCM